MTSLSKGLFFLLLLFLPTQLGKHFFISQSLVLGRRIDYLSPTIYLTDILLLLTLVTYVFENKQKLFTRKVLQALGIIILTILISLVTAQFKIISLYYGLKLVELSLLAWLVISKKPNIWQVLKPLSIGIIIEVILAVAQFLDQSSLGGILYFLGERTFAAPTPGIAQVIINGQIFLRSYATFPHPNVFGGYLATLLPLFLFSAFKINSSKQKYKSIFFITRATIILSLLGIFLSFSRTAWLATLGILTVYLVIVFGKRVRRVNALVILFIVIIIIEELTLARFTSLWYVDRESVFERRELFQASLAMISDSPFFGKGLGNFIPTLPTYLSPPYILQPVHSIFMLIFAESGIFGLFIFLGILLKASFACLTKKQIGVGLSLAIVLFLGLFDHYFYTIEQGQLLFALILALAFVNTSLAHV